MSTPLQYQATPHRQQNGELTWILNEITPRNDGLTGSFINYTQRKVTSDYVTAEAWVLRNGNPEATLGWIQENNPAHKQRLSAVAQLDATRIQLRTLEQLAS